MKQPAYLPVIVFTALAYGLSFACSKLPPVAIAGNDVKDLLCGMGPLLSGIICYQLFKTPTQYSIQGNQPLKAWGIVALSVITFMVTNRNSSTTANLVLLCTQLVYCFGEEFGWRHYLQSATNGSNKWLQVLVIGVIWFGWHFTWLDHPIEAMMGSGTKAPFAIAAGMALLMLVLFAAFLRWAIDRSGSLLLPVLAHFVIKTNGITAMVTLGCIVVALLTWQRWTIGTSPKPRAQDVAM